MKTYTDDEVIQALHKIREGDMSISFPWPHEKDHWLLNVEQPIQSFCWFDGQNHGLLVEGRYILMTSMLRDSNDFFLASMMRQDMEFFLSLHVFDEPLSPETQKLVMDDGFNLSYMDLPQTTYFGIAICEEYKYNVYLLKKFYSLKDYMTYESAFVDIWRGSETIVDKMKRS